MSEQDPGQGEASRRAQRRAQAGQGEELVEGEAEGGTARPAVEILDRNQRIRNEAARKREAARQGKERAPRATGLAAGEMVDDAFTRGTHATVGWVRKHFNVVQWLVLGGVAVAVGSHLYSHRREGQIQAASDVLGLALDVEQGRVGETADRGPDRMSGLTDVQRSFSSETDRLKALAQAYDLAKVQSGSKGAAILAQMGAAGIAFQRQDFKAAAKLYAEVKASDFAVADNDLKGRALLGISQSKEALNDVDGALTPLRELENMGATRFAPIAQYQQARLLHARGESEKAKPFLEKALKKLQADKSKDAMERPSELEGSIRELLVLIDPSKAEAPSNSAMTPEQIQRLQAQLAEMGKQPAAPKQSKNPLEK